jgi:sugar-specific transcriptional regulator TrmB
MKRGIAPGPVAAATNQTALRIIKLATGKFLTNGSDSIGMDTDNGTQLLQRLNLKEYEAMALDELLQLGRTTAPNLAEATGIPKARIYGVLESLGELGYIEIIPGRPKEFQPKPPEEILSRAKANRRQEYEDYYQELNDMQEGFLEHYGPLFERASEEVSPTEELFYVVDVGEPSLRETREIYRDASEQLHIMTKSFEYLEDVRPALRAVSDRDLDIKLLFLHPDHLLAENAAVQDSILDQIEVDFPTIEYRFSNQPMTWRGTIADPSMDYETGTAIFLVEEKDVPLHMRQAAVTENGSFVAGMDRYFSLIWEYDSVPAADG